jgi:2-iminobutanoate/2-iminopropanoate deaminase
MASEVKHYPMYYHGVKQVCSNVPPGSPIYAKEIAVGNLIFVSGMTAQDTETGVVMVHDIASQMNVALTKVKMALEEAGSCMDNVIKTLILLKNPTDYTVMRRSEVEFYQKYAPLLLEEPPVSTLIHVPQIGSGPEYLVEIEVVAVVSRKK